jgi:hypothetical protein
MPLILFRFMPPLHSLFHLTLACPTKPDRGGDPAHMPAFRPAPSHVACRLVRRLRPGMPFLQKTRYDKSRMMSSLSAPNEVDKQCKNVAIVESATVLTELCFSG